MGQRPHGSNKLNTLAYTDMIVALAKESASDETWQQDLTRTTFTNRERSRDETRKP